MELNQALTDYLSCGSRSRLIRLFDTIKAAPNFDYLTDWHQRSATLLEQGRYDEAIRLVTEAMPGAFLCCDAHSMLGYAYARIREHDKARREWSLADTAVRAILDSGDGSDRSPWLVLRVVDEYAVLRHLGLRPTEQQVLRTESGGLLDTHALADGTQRWFELA